MANERFNPGESPEALRARSEELVQEVDDSERKIAEKGSFSPKTALREGMRHVFLIREQSKVERDLNILAGDNKYEDDRIDFLASEWTIKQATEKGDYTPLIDFYRNEGNKIMGDWQTADHLLLASAFFNLANALPDRGEPFRDSMLQENV